MPPGHEERLCRPQLTFVKGVDRKTENTVRKIARDKLTYKNKNNGTKLGYLCVFTQLKKKEGKAACKCVMTIGKQTCCSEVKVFLVSKYINIS